MVVVSVWFRIVIAIVSLFSLPTYIWPSSSPIYTSFLRFASEHPIQFTSCPHRIRAAELLSRHEFCSPIATAKPFLSLIRPSFERVLFLILLALLPFNATSVLCTVSSIYNCPCT